MPGARSATCSTLLALSALGSACSPPPGRSAAEPMPAAAPGSPRYGAVEPARAESTFRVLGGFRMQLIAAEPLVYDPVAMVYDENGRAYVAEMSDYPYTDRATARAYEDQTTQRPIGRVRILEDENADGVFDRSTVFADGLSWPTGLAVWKGGVYVAATPDIWYLKDTDGDRRADVRELAWTGFRKFNVQGVINNLAFGLDHRFYGAGASNGGLIRPGSRPDAEPVELGRNDFRFDPATGRFEAISGGARFGNSFDDWGNRFIAHVSNPVQHVVLDDRYLRRNPHLPLPSSIHDAAGPASEIPLYKISPPEAWRAIRARRRLSDPRYADEALRDLDGVAHWTAATGVTVYRGDAYPAEYRGNVFIGEVASNAIHRQAVAADGVTFRSARADAGAEFVASTDTWFRGVNMVNAPDGTLHVLDMYREVVEHPWSLPEDVHAELDLLSGTDRGRIYRLAPPGFRAPRIPRLGEATTAELVGALESGNGWRRDSAHRLLFERQDRSAVHGLRALVAQSASPLARMHALWSLEGLGALRPEDVARGLADSTAQVRVHAVRLAERRLKDSPALLDRVLERAGDPDIRVRFQTAFALGEVRDSRATAALARIARRDAGDRWVRTAVASSASGTEGEILAELLRDSAFVSRPSGEEMPRLLAEVLGARNEPGEIRLLLHSLRTAPASRRQVHGLVQAFADGLGRNGRDLRSTVAVGDHTAGAFIDAVLGEARSRAADEGLGVEERVAAARLLAHDAPDAATTLGILARLLAPAQPVDVQRAAVQGLSRGRSPRAAEILLAGWGNYTPRLRDEVSEALLARPERIGLFLDAVERGTIAAAHVAPLVRSRLTGHADRGIGARASSLFAAGGSRSRDEVVARYRAGLRPGGDRARGRAVYQQLCSACHRIGDTGTDVGPNLASVRHKSPEELLVLILDPNREVAPEYLLYLLRLRSGESTAGVIASENPSSISLARPGGATETILRTDIVEMTTSGSSLMPEGLEAAIDPAEMSDLIAFLLQPG